MPRPDRARLAVLGGSSAFFPSLASALEGEAARLPALRIHLCGRDPERTVCVARFCNLHAAAAKVDHEYLATTDLDAAVVGAQIVVNQVRVGGFAGRSSDEQLALEFGFPGDETIGPAGLAAAIRSLPTTLALAERVEELAPDCWFVQVSNPMSMLLDGILRHTRLRSFGLCELPERTLEAGLALLPSSSSEVSSDYVGLNHQGWFVRIERDGEDLLPAIYRAAEALPDGGFFQVRAEAMRRRGGLALPYLRMFEHRGRELDRQRGRTADRGVVLGQLADRLYTHYAETDDGELPPQLLQRDMPWNAMTIAPVLRALLGGEPARAYVSEPNGGYYDFLPRNSIVEKHCVVSAVGPTSVPLRIGGQHVSNGIETLLRQVAEFEGLGAAAALRADDELAVAALTAHPFEIPESTAREMVGRMLQGAARSLS